VLITDGLENCNADPCALGKELEQAGVDFTAHIVGFGLTAEEGRQVACLAENTGGKYIQASDAGQLQ
jgi:Ca-activated chloride channel family protein